MSQPAEDTCLSVDRAKSIARKIKRNAKILYHNDALGLVALRRIKRYRARLVKVSKRPGHMSLHDRIDVCIQEVDARFPNPEHRHPCTEASVNEAQVTFRRLADDVIRVMLPHCSDGRSDNGKTHADKPQPYINRRRPRALAPVRV